MSKENTSLEERRSTSAALTYWYDTPEGINLIKQMYAPEGCSDLEFAAYVSLCRDFKLDPKRKEVHMEFRNVKDKGRVPIFIIHRDGYLSIAKRHPDYLGLSGDVVYSNDTFHVKTFDGKTIVEHSYGIQNRGEVKGAWAIARRKGCDDMYKFSSYEIYKKANNMNSNYTTYPDEMILKVAHSYVLRLQFEIFGFDSEETVDSYTTPIQEKKKVEVPKKISKPKSDETIAIELLSDSKDPVKVEPPKKVETVPKLEPEYRKEGDKYVKISKEEKPIEKPIAPPPPKKDTPESLKEDFLTAMENGFAGSFKEFIEKNKKTN
jgi:phage recombination protein Bet